MRIIGLLSLVLIGVVAAIGQIKPAVSANCATLTVVVTDVSGNRIMLPAPQITVTGPKVKINAIQSSEGTFSIPLGSGIFEITVDANGYYRLKRSKIMIECNKGYTLNLKPLPRYTTLGTSVSKRGDVDKRVPAPQYKIVFEDELVSLGIFPVIQYLSKRSKGGVVEYQTAVLSYNFVTIYADSVELDKKFNTLTCSGTIVVDDGVVVRSWSSAILKLINGKVVIQIN